MAHRPTCVRPFALVVLLMLAACASTPSAASRPAVPGGGVVTGRLISQRSDGSERVPVAGQAIGVFDRALIPGIVLQHPPRPIVTTVTSHDGSFTFHSLAPGRYFISVVGDGPSVAGRWVVISSSRGASVLLVSCTNCPVPL